MIEKAFLPFIRKNRSLVTMIVDLMIVTSAFFLVLVFGNNYFQTSIDLRNIHTITVALTIVITFAVSYYLFKTHKSIWAYISLIDIVRVLFANAVATVISLVFITQYRLADRYLWFLLFSSFIATLMSIATRLLFYIIQKNMLGIKTNLKNGDAKRSVIIGAGDAGYILRKELYQNPEYHYQLLGFIDDEKANSIVSGLPVFGEIKDIPWVVREKDIETIFIAIPSASRAKIVEIYHLCHDAAVKEIKIMRSIELLSSSGSSNVYPLQKVSIEDLLGRGQITLNQSEISDYLSGKRVLVTGASGSIGQELCRQIIKFNPEILYLVDFNENQLYLFERELIEGREKESSDKDVVFVSYLVNIREKESVDRLFEKLKPEIIFHAAAHKHVPVMERSPQEAIKNNIFGTLNVIDLAIKHQVERFIMISTDKAVNPTNIMGATKRFTELILQSRRKNGTTKLAAVRFGNVLGSAGSVIPIFKRQISEGGPITLTDKRMTRYFMTIPEAAQLVLQAGYYADDGEIFLLDMGDPVLIKDLAENLIKLSGLKPYQDIEIVEVGLRPGEKMYEELSYDFENSSKTRHELIFMNQPQNIDEIEVNDIIVELKNSLDLNVDNESIKNQVFKAINNYCD